jgi:S1-C subfamily serine protease
MTPFLGVVFGTALVSEVCGVLLVSHPALRAVSEPDDGTLLKEVKQHSAAFASGLRTGDVVTKVRDNCPLLPA